MKQIIGGMAYLHEKKIIHRGFFLICQAHFKDLALRNILVEESKSGLQVKISGFLR